MMFLCALIHFLFLTAYMQDFRSSTIEPFFESLPGHLRNLNPRKHLLLEWGSLVEIHSYEYSFYKVNEHPNLN